jgi:pantoate--beta-alanine ligase
MTPVVDPLQLAPNEDLARRPRDPEGDAAKARERGVHLLFVPDVAEIYPRPPRVLVTPGALADRWEGGGRPGHFARALTVVAKLFHLVQPDVAVFEQNDAPQAVLIRAMVADLDMPIELVFAPTTRESDGLAMSSRNVYLSAEDRRRALVLSRALRATEAQWRSAVRDGAALVAAGRALLDTEPTVQVDYFTVADAATLEPLDGQATGDAIAMVAARVGRARLIDNLPLPAAEGSRS